MARTDRNARGAFALLALVAGLLGASAASATTLITDPSGDSSGVVDVLSVSAGFSSTTLFLSGTFAPGTFDPLNGAFNIGLDIDLDPSTGIDCSGGLNVFPCGAEWQVSYNSHTSTTMAFLVDNSDNFFAGFAPVFDTNSFSIDVLLDPDPNVGLPDDGLVLFGIVAGVPDPGDGIFGPDDFAPDGSEEGPLGGPSSPIPEPGSGPLLAAGLAALARARTRARAWPCRPIMER